MSNMNVALLLEFFEILFLAFFPYVEDKSRLNPVLSVTVFFSIISLEYQLYGNSNGDNGYEVDFPFSISFQILR